MKILRYIGLFFAGAFLANSIPHLVHGISGEMFQTPFANPSSPLVNILWAAFNILAGYFLLVMAKGFKLGF